MSNTTHPFDLLQQLADQCRQRVAGLSAQQVVAETWSGIGFRVAGQPMVAAIGEISEILHEPPYTALPRVKPWVRGVANVRSRLLPIIDLSHFLDAPVSAQRQQRRVLVLDRDELFVGLLVDELFGMQHFPVDGITTSMPALPEAFRRFVVGAYKGDQISLIFNFRALVHDPAFLDVGI